MRDIDLCFHDDAPALLVRPDQHIAWRGTQMPPDSVDVILDRVLGRGAASTNAAALTPGLRNAENVNSGADR